ncbi:hypothetical protein Q5P01_004007 [Channa striata]|uniref:Uncharacterized protein n=1 Tax=Channa striata TaxID=64152 RepID=A0AA88NIL8_CHASR|nr:hypothetical protein Q5P01_004007 [Channa striata]
MSTTNKNPFKENELVPSDSEDDFKYEEVSLDDWSLSEGEEDLEATVKAIKERAEAKARAAPAAHEAAQRAQSVDVFLRNFLFHAGMTETLDCFQTEWTEMLQRGLLNAELVHVVPAVYVENQRLEGELKNAERDRDELKLAASAAAQTLGRVQKARDFHRMQHKRVVQEKNRLVEEVRKLKVQCDSYEPAVKRMSDKYQAVLRQTMLVTMERDKALAQASAQSSQHGASSPGDPGEAKASAV